MRNGIGGIAVGVALLAAPAMAAAAGGGTESQPRDHQQTTKVPEARIADLDEMREMFFERLGALIAAPWMDARGTIVPDGAESANFATSAASSCSDSARGTIVPPNCS